MNATYDFAGFFEFIKNAEKLKTELRHSWTSSNTRQESVAEHTWMTSLIAVLLMDKTGINLDPLKVLKMIIIHDLVEVFAGDIPSHELSSRQETKQQNERTSLQKLLLPLSTKTSTEISALWEEFELCETNEAKFARSLDKFECLVQHYIVDISTWDEGDYRYTFIDKQDTCFNFDPFMRHLKNELDRKTHSKLEKAGTVENVPMENLELYASNQKKTD